jgi:hypothetical protein
MMKYAVAFAILATPVVFATELAPPTIVNADADGDFVVTMHVSTVAEAVAQHEEWAEAAAKIRPFKSVISTTTPRMTPPESEPSKRQSEIMGYDITLKYLHK